MTTNRLHSIGWWYWLAMVVVLAGEVAGFAVAAALAVALGVAQATHFAARECSLTAFTVQVKLVCLGLLVAGLWPLLVAIHWTQLAGTTVRVAFDYCLLARTLSLMPWNRRRPPTPALVWRTYAMPPVKGSIVQARAAGA
jgi:hypothetical protein